MSVLPCHFSLPFTLHSFLSALPLWSTLSSSPFFSPTRHPSFDIYSLASLPCHISPSHPDSFILTVSLSPPPSPLHLPRLPRCFNSRRSKRTLAPLCLTTRFSTLCIHPMRSSGTCIASARWLRRSFSAGPWGESHELHCFRGV